jgi:hypothetical protein
MKKLLLIFTLLFSALMFSTPSHAEWTKVSSTGNGAHTFYVDFERIRKHDGYIYYWLLTDYLKPNKFGDLSAKVYKQGDCKLFRNKILTDSYYKNPMGVGTSSTSNEPEKNWTYPSPNSVSEYVLKAVCNQ